MFTIDFDINDLHGIYTHHFHKKRNSQNIFRSQAVIGNARTSPFVLLVVGITNSATKKPTTFWTSQLSRLLRIGRQNHQLPRPVGIAPQRKSEGKMREAQEYNLFPSYTLKDVGFLF